MPIYAYKCESCGHRQDALQKISDAPLAVCPACGASTYVKQLTAAGFQLKGSGWYVTDFRGGSAAAEKPAEGDAAAKGEKSEKPEKADAKPADTASPAAAPAPAPTPAATTAASPAPAAGKAQSPSSGSA